MQEILLVDIGNSRIKWAVADQDRLGYQQTHPWREAELEAILNTSWGELDQINAVYISNVAGKKIGKIICNWCKKNWGIAPKFAKVSEQACGVKNSYSDPEKLGVDRWLAMIAGWDLVKKRVCIIDCGSAITFDVIDHSGQHLGGVIAPGLALCQRALTDHTYALSIEKRGEHDLLASDTETAINAGCYHQFIGGIKYVLTKITQQSDADIECVITGGDAELVTKEIDLSEAGIKMRYEADLVLQGLMLSSRL